MKQDKTPSEEAAKFFDHVLMGIGYGMLWHRFGLYIAFMVFCVLGAHAIGNVRLLKILSKEKGD